MPIPQISVAPILPNPLGGSTSVSPKTALPRLEGKSFLKFSWSEG